MFRFWAQLPCSSHASAALVMTLSFLTLGPMAIGYITIGTSAEVVQRGVLVWLFLPWPAILLSCLMTYLLNLEGLICVVFALPVGFLFGSIGGLIAGLAGRGRVKQQPTTLACVALLPMLVMPLEAHLIQPTIRHRIVQTEIEIHAPASVVWDNIKRVRPIAPSELEPTWTHAIGFPRPVEATLSYEGVGGVRHASFEHGLLFIETVSQWEPNRVLAFSIKADTKDIPPTTLDSHVRIGGSYFDVLRGEYRLQPLPDGNVMLHLSSAERVSTDFNGYAGLWSDAVMRSLQESILKVIKARCEGNSQVLEAKE